MKRILLALAAVTLLSNAAFATKIGVSMDKFDDNFLTVCAMAWLITRRHCPA